MRIRSKSVSLRGITGDSSVNRAKYNRRFSRKEQNGKRWREIEKDIAKRKRKRERERMRDRREEKGRTLSSFIIATKSVTMT